MTVVIRLELKNKGSENAAFIKILLVKTVKEIRYNQLLYN